MLITVIKLVCPSQCHAGVVLCTSSTSPLDQHTHTNMGVTLKQQEAAATLGPCAEEGKQQGKHIRLPCLLPLKTCTSQ